MQMLQVDAVMYHSPTKSMATEIPSRQASWEAPRNNYMTLSGPSQDAVLVAKAQNCLISTREPKATSDVPGQKGVVILTQRSRSQSTTRCGEGPAYP